MSEREFVAINEEAARTAQNMMSFNEYQLGSRTKEYQEDVNEVYDLAEEVVARRGEEYRERAWRLATRYAKNLGKYFNEEARIGCMCPSVMISGAGNFPVKKKEKQVKAWDKNHEFYNYCQSIRGKLNNLLYSKEVFKVIENTELMRIQIVFDGKPNEAIRNTLKANGFRWAPSQGAWQRQLTSNGKYALRRVIEELGAEVQAS